MTDVLVSGKDCAMLQKCDVEHGTGYEPLVVKQNVCYIVAGVIINDCNEVLMVQEAKSTCYGKWYLPAGRMEQNETIVEGVRREVLEEAGLEFEPISILCIEECGGYWVRIAVIGKAVGGTLKTTEQADEESLQAMWWNSKDEIPIRCKDILPLIDMGFKWIATNTLRQKNLLPTVQAQSMLFLRVIAVQLQDNGDFSVLLHKGQDGELCAIPTSRIHPQDRSFYKAVESLLDKALELTEEIEQLVQLKTLGVLAVEHSGESALQRDGMGLSVVVRITSDTPLPCSENFAWWRREDIPDRSLAVTLSDRISNDSLTPLRSLKDKMR